MIAAGIPGTSLESASSNVSPTEEMRESLLIQAQVDQSSRRVVLLFIASSISWLIIGSFFSLIECAKMHLPNFLSDYAFLTYGRLSPAITNIFLYGWLGTCGIGAGLWLTARLCRTPFTNKGYLIVAWLLWNLGINFGVFEIFAGNGTSVQGLEFPNYISPLLFIAYAFIAVWGILMFRFRRESFIYVSLCYMLAAFLWFPWSYATANLMVHFLPIEASAKMVINWWYIHNFYGLCLTPFALGLSYYLIPKVLVRPISRYSLAMFGFWTLAIFSGWNGLQYLIDGPIPAWMVSVSISASILYLIPLVIIIYNLFGTLRMHYDAWRWSPTIRFIVVGTWCFVGATLEWVFLASRTVNDVIHFTLFFPGYDYLALYGFVSMTFFGAIYYIVPRVYGWNWPSSSLIRWHFWLSVLGLGLVFFSYSLAGVMQGFGLGDKEIPVIAIINLIKPFLYFTNLGMLLLFVAHVIFGASFVLLLCKVNAEKWPTPPLADLIKEPSSP